MLPARLESPRWSSDRYICNSCQSQLAAAKTIAAKEGEGAEMMLPTAAQPRRQTTLLALCINGNVEACDSQPPSPILDYASAAAIAWPLQRAALPAACPCQRSGNATRLSPYQLDFPSVSPHLLIAVTPSAMHLVYIPSFISPVQVLFSPHSPDSTLVSFLLPSTPVVENTTQYSIRNHI